MGLTLSDYHDTLLAAIGSQRFRPLADVSFAAETRMDESRVEDVLYYRAYNGCVSKAPPTLLEVLTHLAEYCLEQTEGMTFPRTLEFWVERMAFNLRNDAWGYSTRGLFGRHYKRPTALWDQANDYITKNGEFLD